MRDAEVDSPLGRRAAVLARVVRGGVVESEHHGHAVALDGAGAVVVAAGEPGVQIFARSSLKPLQAVAMLGVGLHLEAPLLALACASHNGETRHLEGARRILAGHGLDESALQNTPDLPIGVGAQRSWLARGLVATSLTQNCSGKHAAMLATCVVAGWDTAGYLDPEHPLQQRIRATVSECTGDPAEPTSVDGCGAPLFSCTLAGLARAFGRLGRAGAAGGGSPEALVARAMSGNPGMVAGEGRDVTALLAGVPGLVAKDGAEGVYAAGLADGSAAALKVLDGSQRPRPAVMSALLGSLGVDAPVLAEVGRVPVLGHGRPVGEVVAVAPRGPTGPAAR